MNDAQTSPPPLQGWRVVVTRAADSSDKLARQLASLGAEPVFYPTIAFAPPADPAPLDAALQRATGGGYRWLILTSATTVQVLAERLQTLGLRLDSPDTPPVQVAAVGSATAAACQQQLGLVPAVVPDTFVAEALAEALGAQQAGLHGQRILLANADLSRPVLQEQLQQAGAYVERLIAYHTVAGQGGADVPALLLAGRITAITFTSGSTARSFVQRIQAESHNPAAVLQAARCTVIACIGPIAAEAARAVGLPPTLVAEPSTMAGLAAALAAFAGTGPVMSTHQAHEHSHT